MELMMDFLTSKLFLFFLILIIVFNIVRRRHRNIQSRSARAQSRLKNKIRNRQMDRWNPADEDGASPDAGDTDGRSS